MNESVDGIASGWREAEGSLPPGWRLMGVVRGPRGAHPEVAGHDWVAWARPDPGAGMADDIPDVEGSGPTAAAALGDLAERLRGLAGN